MNKQSKQTNSQTNNSEVVTRAEVGCGEEKGSNTWCQKETRRWMVSTQCNTQLVLQNCTPETYGILLTNAIPMNEIFHI